MTSLTCVLLGGLMLATAACAQVRQVNQFTVAPRRPAWTLLDLSGQFEQQVLGLTPSGDILDFSVHRNGTWELYRVRGWETQKPSVDHLQLPGYFSGRDRHNLETLEANIFPTADSKYAVCVGTARWLKRVHGRAVGRSKTESIITVVDLSDFKVVNSTHTKTVSPFEFQSIQLDHKGRVVIMNSNENLGEFVQLEIPSLRSSPSCTYSAPIGKSPTPVTVAACRENLGTVELKDYLGSSQGAPTRPGFSCTNKSLNYCPEPFRFTSDGRFGLGMYTEGYDDLFGSWDMTRAIAVLFSTRTRSEIGDVDLEHGNPIYELAVTHGKDYLLVLRRGSELTVYELFEPQLEQTVN